MGFQQGGDRSHRLALIDKLWAGCLYLLQQQQKKKEYNSYRTATQLYIIIAINTGDGGVGEQKRLRLKKIHALIMGEMFIACFFCLPV